VGREIIWTAGPGGGTGRGLRPLESASGLAMRWSKENTTRRKNGWRMGVTAVERRRAVRFSVDRTSLAARSPGVTLIFMTDRASSV